MKKKLELLHWLAGESLKAATERWKSLKALPKSQRELLRMISQHRPVPVEHLAKFMGRFDPSYPSQR